MSDPSSLRVADADRERVADELREHMVAGRLTSEEFEERLGRAYRATTRAELDALRVDLPISPAAREARAGRAQEQAAPAPAAGGRRVGWASRLVCVAIWLATGASGSFWPVWVIIFTLLPLVRDAWRLLGPAPDLEAVEAHLDGPPRAPARARAPPRSGTAGLLADEPAATRRASARSPAAPSATARRRASRASSRCASAWRCCSTRAASPRRRCSRTGSRTGWAPTAW